MKTRQWHMYIGCFFAPLLIYFCLSGAWQVFGLHDLPRHGPSTASQRLLHELSRPHRDAVRPGSPKDGAPASLGFKVLSAVMAIGFVLTAFLGIQLGWQVPRRRKAVLGCLVAGAVLPLLLLLL